MERKAASQKNKGGRPKKTIDYDKLKKMCSIHCTGEECASLLDMDYDTLNNALVEDGHGGFSDFFKKHSAGGKMSLRRKQFEKAVTEGNVPMLIWLGKQYLGQKDLIEDAPHHDQIQIRIVDATRQSDD